MPTDLAELLDEVAARLPGGGEHRPGQQQMAAAVERAVRTDRHLVVQAGTGTGKSLAYLLPVVRSGRTVVVATATKALQDQLAQVDLPFLAAQVGADTPFTVAVLKGRSNYLCRQRAAEMAGTSADAETLPGLDGDGEPVSLGRFGAELRTLLAWSATTATGDRADLDVEPHPRAWSALSVSARDCPGAFRCPSGDACFAERARTAATAADVVVVNLHLYAAHVASGGSVLPPHDLVVFDEAHEVEDVMTAGLGVELTAGRLRALAATARAAGATAAAADAVGESADRLDGLLADAAGRRVFQDGADGELADGLGLARGRVEALAAAVRAADADGAEADSRRARSLLAAGHLVEDLDRLVADDADQVAFVESGGGGRGAVLRLAPIEIGGRLAADLWPQVTAVLTSATIPPGLADRLGLPAASTDVLAVDSPFPYRARSMLYVPRDLPDRRRAEAEAAIHDEMQALITAAGGRTLALFTSWRAMTAAVEALRPRLPFPILAQNERPKAKLVAAFAADESACLFATLSFWQGVDVPGRTLSLVVIDRLPFPRPDDPLLQARRDRAGAEAFARVDLPRAAMRLAQGAGRLIRSSRDAGVVAVLDPRLATAGYRRRLLESVPPMRRSVRRDEAVAFLAQVAAGTLADDPPDDRGAD